jgi:hypothetical protein
VPYTRYRRESKDLQHAFGEFGGGLGGRSGRHPRAKILDQADELALGTTGATVIVGIHAADAKNGLRRNGPLQRRTADSL